MNDVRPRLIKSADVKSQIRANDDWLERRQQSRIMFKIEIKKLAASQSLIEKASFKASPDLGAASNKPSTSRYNVLYLAVSLWESNISSTWIEAGYPYLKYCGGEVSDRIKSDARQLEADQFRYST